MLEGKIREDHFFKVQSGKKNSVFLLTVERDAAVRVSQGVLGHTFVLHEVDPDQISNAQLHVNFIATHNSKGLVFCV